MAFLRPGPLQVILAGSERNLGSWSVLCLDCFTTVSTTTDEESTPPDSTSGVPEIEMIIVKITYK